MQTEPISKITNKKKDKALVITIDNSDLKIEIKYQKLSHSFRFLIILHFIVKIQPLNLHPDF